MNFSDDDDCDGYEGDEMQNFNYLCFICETTCSQVNEWMNHTCHVHGLNIKNILKSAQISSDYEWIQFVNYMRKNKAISAQDIAVGIWKDDEYLIPQIQDDNLLFIDFETLTECNDDNEVRNYQNKIAELESKILCYEDNISNLRKKVVDLLDLNDDEDIINSMHSGSTKLSKLSAEDNAYFTGYSHYSIHDTMIKDKVRTESYRKFIEENGSEYFKDKIVLDVGCGTGILSMFAARSGAAHVYGVDCAEIIYDAMEIVEKNNLKDKVTLIHGKLEEIDLPCDKVDVIISEWMGYFLIYESMLDSVLFACRKYLNPIDGLVFPCYFTLNIAGGSLSTYRNTNVNCWDSVFGFDMSSMKMNVIKEVIVDIVPIEDVITSSFMIRDYNVQQMAFDSTSMSPQIVQQSFELIVNKTGKMGAIIAYFDTYFKLPGDNEDLEQVMFSTGPGAPTTHWQQTILMLNEEIDVLEGQTIRGVLNVSRHAQGKRGLNFSLYIGDNHQNFEFS